jgi:hypothetical protein
LSLKPIEPSQYHAFSFGSNSSRPTKSAKLSRPRCHLGAVGQRSDHRSHQQGTMIECQA